MKKRPSPFIRAILFFFVTSFLVGLWVLGHETTFLSFAAKKHNPWDDCAIGRLCRAPEDNKRRDKTKFPDANCVTVSEGCLDELKCTTPDGKTTQWFNLGRRKDCGHKEEQAAPTPTPTATPIPTPTPTPTPIPTATPTPTPTPTPTAGPTPTPTPTSTPGPTPTPTPPQVLGAEAPKALPKTGFPTEAIFGVAVIGEVLGWLILRKFRS